MLHRIICPSNTEHMQCCPGRRAPYTCRLASLCITLSSVRLTAMFNHLEHFFNSLWDKFQKDEQARTQPSSWPSWELDPAFFQAMSRWTMEHPESSLDKVMDNVCSAIENSDSVMQFIPDSPFPARSLVTALVHLLRLGIAISTAKSAVYDFAKQIVHWLGQIQANLKGNKKGRFSRATIKNLSHFRDLIDEICTWATTRLNDRRWSGIKHGLTIAKEIEDFKTRIASARALFVDIAFIKMAEGIDTILAEIEKIRQHQKDQLEAIRDQLNAQEQAQTRKLYLAQMLKTAANPTYDHQGKLPCDEGTRVEILAEIMEWINDKSNESQGFLWLTGEPGAGKSAITASIARTCKDDGILWAQFFINRNNVETTDPRLYFPSIARQFIDHSAHPDVAIAIVEALKSRPSLMDGISHIQASQLFVNAFTIACASNQEQPVVVVIDGLDETDPAKLADTAQIFSQIFSSLSGQTTRNAKVLISSRTDDDIRTPFAKMMDPRHVKHIHLDTSAPSSIRDVSTYLGIQIARIVEENDLNWLEWPGEARMVVLCGRASGLFIWAVTVAKFFEDQIHDIGTECLNDLINTFSAEGTGNINILYWKVIQLAYRNTKDPWRFEIFRRIVGCVATLKEPLPISAISNLLNLRQTASSSPVDVIRFFRQTRTVLVAGADAVDGETVPRLHKSFFEFITSDHADSNFRINIHNASGELALQSIRQLGYIFKQGVSESAPDTPESRYALRFWGSHLGQAEKVVSGLCVLGHKHGFHAVELESVIDHFQTQFWEADSPPMEVNMVTTFLPRLGGTHGQKLVSISDGKLISKPISWVERDADFTKNVMTKLQHTPDGHQPQLMNTSSGSPVVRHGLPGLPRTMTGPCFFDVTDGWSGNQNHSKSKSKNDSGTQMQWIPFDHRSGSGDFRGSLWAYIDGALIRSNGPNSVVILDLRGYRW
ncbi:hypothetical protein FIBSPDRAFT_1046139 [Athelia psychrophila]|uniref:Nephrocystin 3-like N-terminal domain-containing protein n=1 Tax=Athelia psychrophila TaxID=1759441 RepID=A0A166H2R1_9AGAM|nr:hypothetical protein FIBSPDRAFT_1046139 [Fibularhizoctonia sp. CBS 109695]